MNTEHPTEPAPSGRRLPRRTLAIIIAAVAVVVIAAAVVAVVLVSRPGKFDAAGSMSLVGYDSYTPTNDGGRCVPQDGYDDVSQGTQVVVTDDKGATVAVGTLGVGRISDTDDCEFKFQVTDIPAGSKFYKVEVGRRGGLQYTEQDLRDGVALQLGS